MKKESLLSLDEWVELCTLMVVMYLIRLQIRTSHVYSWYYSTAFFFYHADNKKQWVL